MYGLSRLGELIEDWQFLLRRYGWKPAWRRISQDIIALPYRKLEFVVVARPLTLLIPDAHPKVAVDVRPFTAADFDFVRREHLPSEAHLCARRLERGHDGIAGCINGEIAGYAWSCTDTSLERVDLPLAPGDVLFTDAFTAPAARGQGVQTVLSTERLLAAQRRGYQRIVAYIEIHNAPSLAVWRKKMGASVINHITFTRVGLWRKTTYVDTQ
jgi:GNAT superfamily N-acetyltransferase